MSGSLESKSLDSSTEPTEDTSMSLKLSIAEKEWFELVGNPINSLSESSLERNEVAILHGQTTQWNARVLAISRAFESESRSYETTWCRFDIYFTSCERIKPIRGSVTSY